MISVPRDTPRVLRRRFPASLRDTLSLGSMTGFPVTVSQAMVSLSSLVSSQHSRPLALVNLWNHALVSERYLSEAKARVYNSKRDRDRWTAGREHRERRRSWPGP